MRLVGGETEYEGRVEVCVSGVWGTVCRGSWNSPDADVVCNHLGLNYTSERVSLQCHSSPYLYIGFRHFLQ